jgi:hypothetical protein
MSNHFSFQAISSVNFYLFIYFIITNTLINITKHSLKYKILFKIIFTTLYHIRTFFFSVISVKLEIDLSKKISIKLEIALII